MSRRDDLIETARRLFRTVGYRAAGIDLILAESGAAKATLYKHFRSRDALVAAVLEREDIEFRAALEAHLTAFDTPRDRLLAVFDFAATWFAEPDFNGCVFVNAVAESAAPEDALRALVIEHKRSLRAVLQRELDRLDLAEDTKVLACQLQLLFEGAIVMARLERDPSAALTARAAAAALLQRWHRR